MLGDTLKTLRIKKGATQDDIAALLKIKRQTYSAYERNISLPDISSLRTLAKYFEVSVGDLINDEISFTEEKKDLPLKQQEFLMVCADMDHEELNKLLEYAEFIKFKRNKKNLPNK